MLISIGKPENVPKFIDQVKRREKVLSGFGHRYAYRIGKQKKDPDLRIAFTRLQTPGHTSCARPPMKSSKCWYYPTFREEHTLLIRAL
jgi:hypothetical protein